MGRSQVARNRAARGRGRGRGGREGGRGDGGGSSSSSHRHKGGVDPRKLGNNDFRYERSRTSSTDTNTSGGADAEDGKHAYYEGLLEDINMGGGGSLGEYHGDSHYATSREEDDLALADATLLSAATAALALSSSGRGTNKTDQRQHQQHKNGVEDWMHIDVKALDKCLKQIPIHERLKLPYHIGEHLENMYGMGGKKGGGRKKTLAELREEAKCVISNADPELEKKQVQEMEVGVVDQSDLSKLVQPVNVNDNADADDESDVVADDDDDGEDLEAWLDDMIG